MNAQSPQPEAPAMPQAAQASRNDEFGNALIRSLTDQRNVALNEVAQAVATLSLLSKENEFLNNRVVALEAELAKALSGEGEIGAASTADPNAGPGVATQAARQRRRS